HLPVGELGQRREGRHLRPSPFDRECKQNEDRGEHRKRPVEKLRVHKREYAAERRTCRNGGDVQRQGFHRKIVGQLAQAVVCPAFLNGDFNSCLRRYGLRRRDNVSRLNAATHAGSWCDSISERLITSQFIIGKRINAHYFFSHVRWVWSASASRILRCCLHLRNRSDDIKNV